MQSLSAVHVEPTAIDPAVAPVANSIPENLMIKKTTKNIKRIPTIFVLTFIYITQLK